MDSGATYNYINEELMRRLSLNTIPIEGFEVKVASGTVLSCTQKVP